MNNLVIGSNSFIASKLINDLKKYSNVTGVYHSNRDKLFSDIENYPVQNLKDLGTNYDVVYLLSAYIPVNPFSGDFRKKLFEANIELVETVCEKFKKSRIIYASTVSVYSPKNEAIFENDETSGLNEYGISKLWGEKIIQESCNFSIVRFSSVYGTGMNLNTIIPNYIKQALEKNSITVWGNGEREQDYIHVEDVVNFLKSAAKINENEIFLATSSKSISNRQLASIIASKTGCDITFDYTDLSPSFHYNNTFTINQLKYKASITIDDGITELIKWLKEKS